MWCLSLQNTKPEQQLVVEHNEGEDGCDDGSDKEVMMEVKMEYND
jgi:hypothetical protein